MVCSEGEWKWNWAGFHSFEVPSCFLVMYLAVFSQLELLVERGTLKTEQASLVAAAL